MAVLLSGFQKVICNGYKIQTDAHKKDFHVYSLTKIVQSLAYSEPLIRDIAQKLIRWVVGNS